MWWPQAGRLRRQPGSTEAWRVSASCPSCWQVQKQGAGTRALYLKFRKVRLHWLSWDEQEINRKISFSGLLAGALHMLSKHPYNKPHPQKKSHNPEGSHIPVSGRMTQQVTK